VRTTQPWASGGTEVKTDPNGIGVTMIGMEVAGLTDAMTVRDTMTGIQDIAVTDGGMIGMTEVVDTDETAGQGPHPPEGGRDPGIGTTEDGDGLMKR